MPTSMPQVIWLEPNTTLGDWCGSRIRHVLIPPFIKVVPCSISNITNTHPKKTQSLATLISQTSINHWKPMRPSRREMMTVCRKEQSPISQGAAERSGGLPQKRKQMGGDIWVENNTRWHHKTIGLRSIKIHEYLGSGMFKKVRKATTKVRNNWTPLVN